MRMKKTYSPTSSAAPAAAHLPEQYISLLRKTEAAKKADYYGCDEHGGTRLHRSLTLNERLWSRCRGPEMILLTGGTSFFAVRYLKAI